MRVQEVLESAGLQESEDMIAAVIADQLAAVRQTLDRTAGWSPGESELLRAGGLDPAPLARQEVDALMTEVAATYAQLAASSLSVVEAARVLEVDSSRVRQRLTERTLHGFKLRRPWRIPAWQFAGGREIPGLCRRVSGRRVGPAGTVATVGASGGRPVRRRGRDLPVVHARR